MTQQIGKVLLPVLKETIIVVDELEFIDTGKSSTMAETLCNGCNNELGYDNPKASIRSGNRRFLLCKTCWSSQKLKEG